MAFTSGTVTGHIALLQALETFAGSNGWTSLRSVVYDSPQRELIMRGDGSGADEIYVGVQTYFRSSSGAHNWELAGFTGFDNGLDFDEQPGISPGRRDSGNEGGAFVPLTDQQIDYWFYVNARRIIVIAKIGSTYVNCYLGFVNPFGTTSEFPYPLVIAGCTTDDETPFGSNRVGFSGLTDPIRHSQSDSIQGPMLYRNTDGGWLGFQNGEEDGSDRNAETERCVLPAGRPSTPIAPRNNWYGNNLDYQDFIPNSNNPGNPFLIWVPTTMAGGDLYIPIPATLAMRDPSVNLIGQLDDVFWISAFPGIVSEDTITIGLDTYRIFQNCNRTEQFTFLAIREV